MKRIVQIDETIIEQDNALQGRSLATLAEPS
jgi:hypothetical protein